MSKSIMQDTKACYITDRTDNLHRHHIYYGNGRRKLSEQYGCWVYLTGQLHNQSPYALHCGNHQLDVTLKQECQQKFELAHTREDFVRIFGRSYL